MKGGADKGKGGRGGCRSRAARGGRGVTVWDGHRQTCMAGGQVHMP